jgi:hypothetical protein
MAQTDQHMCVSSVTSRKSADSSKPLNFFILWRNCNFATLASLRHRMVYNERNSATAHSGQGLVGLPSV